MKKRIITLLAVLALLVTCAVFAVQADVNPDTDTCPCGCGLTLTQITTTNDGNFAYSSSGINSGHYIFSADSGPGAALKINADQTVVVYITARLGKEDTSTSYLFPTIDVQAGATLYIVGNGGTITTGFPYKTAGTGRNGYAINIASGATVELSGDLTIRPGNSIAATDAITVGNGGMIYNAGTLTIKDGVKINGAPEGNGGAIYTTGADARVNMEGGTITADASFAGAQGAAVSVYSSAVFNMTGGTIVNNCTASKSGIRVQNAKFYLQGGEIKAVNGGDSRGAFDVISTNASTPSVLLLAGEGKISNPDGGVTANNAYIQDYNSKFSYLYVDNNWTGHANIRFKTSYEKTYGKTYGRISATGAYQGQCGAWDAEKEEFTQGGGHKGDLVASAIASAPGLYGSDGLLMVDRVLLIGEKDGKQVTYWYITAATAFKANKTRNLDNAFVRLACSTSVSVPDGVNGVVDLNGVNLTGITLGEGSTLSIWDQDATAAEPSSATVTGEGAEAYYVRPNGDIYVMNGNKCYRVDMKVTNVSLRPGTEEASMYYTASVTAHADAGIAAWGMAVTLDEDETELTNHLYTQETDTAKMGEFNSVLVKGIAQNENDQNAARGAAPIYAKAYIKLATGEVIMSEAANYSLISLINKIIEGGANDDAIATMATYAWYTALGITA